jgi:exopolysaccharide biosynthesis operon protein EpsL
MYNPDNPDNPKFFDYSRSPQATVMLFLLSLSVLLLSLSAHADESDPLNFIAGISTRYDNNLFLLPSGFALPPSVERSDNITTAYGGLQLDKLYSMQRFKANYTVSTYKYQNNDNLDFIAQNYSAAWLWNLTPYLNGTLSAERQESLNNFQDYRNFALVNIQNIRTTDKQHFEADFSPHGIWHLLGGVTRSSLNNSKTFREEDNFTMNSLDAGVKYDFRSGSAVTLMGHERRGTYDNRTLNAVALFDTRFDESEAEAKLSWLISGKSQVNARAAYVSRVHDNFSQRDYSGFAGNLNYRWTPGGKLSVTLTASSDLSSYQTIDSSYTRNNILSISPAYALSDKVTLRASAIISERTFLGDGVIPSGDRVDKSKSASLEVDWAALRNVTIGGNLMRSSRSSNILGLDFTDTTAGINANLLF